MLNRRFLFGRTGSETERGQAQAQHPFLSIKRSALGGAQPDERPGTTRLHSSEGDVDDLDNPPPALVSAYTHLNACPPLGQYFVSVLVKPRAAGGVRTVPSIRISFALTLRP